MTLLLAISTILLGIYFVQDGLVAYFSKHPLYSAPCFCIVEAFAGLGALGIGIFILFL